MTHTVLIIEDEKLLLQALVCKFTQEGFTVFSASNGQSGLELARKKHPDIILLDLIMPVMDGMTMLRQLRQDKWGKDVNVIFLTNLSDAEKTNESAGLGVHNYLIKCEISLDDIVQKVRKILSALPERKVI
jgi:DNA-binding response OmpR family regulator